MILTIITYLIINQPDIMVNIVDDASIYCHRAVIGCADIQNRNVYIEYGWGKTDELIAHEVTHISMNEYGHPQEFYDKVNELK